MGRLHIQVLVAEGHRDMLALVDVDSPALANIGIEDLVHKLGVELVVHGYKV